MTVVHPELLDEIMAYCQRHNVGVSTFGVHAVRDPRLVFDLRNGRELRRRTIDQVRQYMAKAAEAESGPARSRRTPGTK